MMIYCPNCGRRHLAEFSYEGDASIQRPSNALMEASNTQETSINQTSIDNNEWYDYVYARKNGVENHAELWHHGSGCRQYFVAIRHLKTHEISETLSMDEYKVSSHFLDKKSNIGLS